MTHSVSPAATSSSLFPGRWRALGLLLAALFMVLLDTSIVTNALNTIQRTLDATYAQVQFVLSAYAVAYGALLITGGRLGDLYGRRRMFLIGLSAFTLTSALCGAAWSPASLIFFRVLQGVASALLFPQVSSFIQVLFPLEERPRAFGLLGAVIGLGIIAGPLLGGLLIDADLLHSSWRSIFLINVPVGLLVLWVSARVLPESRSPQASGLDVPSILLLTLGLLLLIYPVIQGRDEGWPLWLLLLLALSLPVLALFVFLQRRLVARKRAPLVELSLFRDRAFLVGAVITFVFQSSVLSYFVAMSLFFQAGLGFSPTRAALTLIAYQVSIAVASLLSVRLVKRLGRRLLTLGTVLLAASLLLTLLILSRTGLQYRGYELIPALIMGGLGFGFIIAPLQNVVLASVNPVHAGSASGMLATLQQVGSALGVAVIGILLFGQLSTGADRISAQERPVLTQALSRAALPAQAVETIADRFTQCTRDRFRAPDPGAVPASCRTTLQALPVAVRQPVTATLTAAATQVRHSNFLAALLVTLRYQLLAYLLCFGLVFLLPRTSRAPAAA